MEERKERRRVFALHQRPQGRVGYKDRKRNRDLFSPLSFLPFCHLSRVGWQDHPPLHWLHLLHLRQYRQAGRVARQVALRKDSPASGAGAGTGGGMRLAERRQVLCMAKLAALAAGGGGWGLGMDVRASNQSFGFWVKGLWIRREIWCLRFHIFRVPGF